MANILEVKNNISKMLNQGAPEEDIDRYIELEGFTLDDVRNARLPQQSISPQQGQIVGVPKYQQPMQAQKKDIIDMLAGVSPQELAEQGKWIQSGILQTGKDLFTIPAHFINQALLNFPRSLYNKLGYQYPEKAQSPVAGVLANVAGVLGGLTSPIASGIGKLVAKGAGVAGNNIMQAPARYKALSNLITGAAYSPTDDISDIKQRAVAGVTSAAIPAVIGGVVAQVKDRSRYAGRLVDSLIKPLKKDFSYGKQPGLEVAKQKITGNTLEKLEENIIKRKDEIGNKIGSIVKKYPNKISNYDNILEPINNAIREAEEFPEINSSLLQRLNAVKSDLGKQKLIDLTPSEAFDLKRKIGKLTKWTGNKTDDEVVNKSLKMTYGKIKERLNGLIPGLKQLNESFANLTSAEIATKYRDAIQQRQNIIGFNTGTRALTGAIISSFATGGDISKSLLVGLGVGVLDKALASPAVKTRLASFLAKSDSTTISRYFDNNPKIKEAVYRISNQLPSRVIDKLNSLNK